ncbi:histone-lysine N-methyltransferase SUVR4-like isoform X2 [Rosa rugosa]|uniref:histone-lysine N-methyltransferase SUVR4-like isoform X2 n=1 Tax=Rosa rugosa TaxID=74645 RepID=UPI002B417AD2|nr:histone-lysine N-methyltransferase SUVR4-like isoform X2 [Rosa rugosa]
MAPSKTQIANAFKASKALGISTEEIRPVLRDLYKSFHKNWEHIEADNYRVLFDRYFEMQENKGEAEKRDERPGKAVHLAEEDQVSKRTGSSFELPLKHSTHSGNVQFPRHVVSGNGRVHPERASAVSLTSHTNYFMKPKNEGSTNDAIVSAEQTSMRRPGPMNGSARIQRPKTDSNGPMNGAARIQRPKTDSNGASISREDKKPIIYKSDITKSTEKVPISLVDDVGIESLPKFNYIPQNIIYQNANLNISLSRIADEDCCPDCFGDCLSAAFPCACARETGGEFVYTPEGLLKEDFLSNRMALVREPDKQPHVYCQDCPIERSKNEDMPEKCKGHVVRRFIKECWRKCGCDMQCGNRVVQRGISCKLQVFWTPQGKGWGVRTLEVLEKGSFVCEYVGEIMTNTELYERNMESTGSERHTYPVTLDADWGSEQILRDEDALCLDATLHGNVARFINHRCFDANLVDIPVQVETPDRHYYHLAFFTTRKVNAFEELNWDYGIDFDDEDHPIEAFQCSCGSPFCRNINRKGKQR